MSLDIAAYLRDLPGFSLNSDNAGILIREGPSTGSPALPSTPSSSGWWPGCCYLSRSTSGSYDTERSARKRWAPVVLIGLAIPTSVSRSAIISVGLALAVLVVLMPPSRRLIALCAAPFAAVGIFMSAPGVIGTLTSLFMAGTSDPSVAYRVTDYPLAERFVQEAPWFGRGGGTYVVENSIAVFDNQYLKTAVELGLVGVVALAAFFLVPMIAALVARRRSDDPRAPAALRRPCRRRAGRDGLLADVRFAVVPHVRQCLRAGDRLDRR